MLQIFLAWLIENFTFAWYNKWYDIEGGRNMAVSYKKLLHMLIDKDMTIADLQKQAGYSANISTRLRNDTYISLESVEKICRALNCKMDEIIEFVPDDGKEE